MDFFTAKFYLCDTHRDTAFFEVQVIIILLLQIASRSKLHKDARYASV